MKEIVAGLSVSMGVNAELTYERRYPATVNSDRETEYAVPSGFPGGRGRKMSSRISPPLLGSEDFAFMLKKKPGAYIGLGAGEPRPNGMHHQPGYDFNDELLALGAAYWTSLTETLLPVRSS